MEIKSLGDICNSSILEELGENFIKDKWISVGAEVDQVFWQKSPVDHDCLRIKGFGV